MRFRVSCPDCGYVYGVTEADAQARRRFSATRGCPQCGVHYGEQDFWDEQNEKRMAQYHNSAKADLSDEEPLTEDAE